jgi:3',5'-cyclic AMP phosphodiesterase CpdA
VWVRLLPRLTAAALATGIAFAGVLGPAAAVSSSEGLGSSSRGHDPVLIAVGDIACDPQSPYFRSPRLCQQDRVGRRVRAMVKHGGDWFVPLGDVQYESGTYADYVRVYDAAFGAVRSVTRPVPGNHEYVTPGARGYFRYFGALAGRPEAPWRSFKPAKGWRVLLLNSNCGPVGGCGAQSPQGKWIRRTLARAKEPCVIAAWHHPLHTSGEYAGDADSRSRAKPLWKLVQAGGADVVLNGHDHIYERFKKLGGVQEFVVGTGGKSHYAITTKAPGSRKRIGHRYGVLRLTLHPNRSYGYAYVAVNGAVLDHGTSTCTNRPKR